MIEQDIYNKQIVELMKKKTVLIERLNELLEMTNARKAEDEHPGQPDGAAPASGNQQPGNKA